MNDVDSAVCVAAERGVLTALEGDCKTPLGAFAERVDTEPAPGAARATRMRLRAFVARGDRSDLRSGERVVDWPSSEEDAHTCGLELGRELTANGVDGAGGARGTV
jgi:hydroxymethylbilane synthase